MTRIAVEIPRVGLVMETARVLRWLKAVGDTVTPGEPLVEVETEKTTIEIEATVGGRLVEILLQPEEQAPVGHRIAWMEDGQPAADGEVTDRIVRATQDAAVMATPQVRLRSSPTARRFATEHRINLAEVPGTGPRGRIQLADVQQAVDGRRASSPTVSPAPVATGDASRLSLSPMRRAMARAMILSTAVIPQFTVSRAVTWTEVQAIRTLLGPSLKQRGLRLSLNDFLLQAVALTLLEFPTLNGVFVGDPNSADAHIHTVNGAHIGLAVSLSNGLVVPVIHGVERMTLSDLTRKRTDLVGRAREGRLRQEEVGGASFTISNLGPEGPDRFTAILNPPESCILAVGRIREVPVVREGAVVVRPESDLTLTVDHRLTDGRVAADFLARLVQILEGKEWLVETFGP